MKQNPHSDRFDRNASRASRLHPLAVLAIMVCDVLTFAVQNIAQLENRPGLIGPSTEIPRPVERRVSRKQ